MDAKGDEIPAFAPLLDAVEQVLGSLHGLVFVADAMHTQTNHATEIAARGADLFIPVKLNQLTLFAQLKALPWAEIPILDPGTDRHSQRRPRHPTRRAGHTARLRLRDGPSEPRPTATPDQVRRLAARMPNLHTRALVITAAYTGMRFGELAARS